MSASGPTRANRTRSLVANHGRNRLGSGVDHRVAPDLEGLVLALSAGE